MLTRISDLVLTRFIWIIVALVLVASAFAARWTGDPHWLNRGGALIAALAAGAVFMQIALEIGLERERHRIEARHSGEAVEAVASPLDRLADRLRKNRTNQQVGKLEQQRLRTALRVVSCAMLGELLHGFGDLLACASLVSCGVH